MATRFLLPSDGPSYGLTPAVAGVWTMTAATFRRLPLTTGPNETPLLAIAHVDAGTNTPQFILAAQFISPPLLAQTITGNASIAFMTLSSSGSANGTPYVVVKVVSSTGAFVGTLFAGRPGTGGNIVSFRVNSAVAFAMTSTAVSAGDRIVVEIGVWHNNTDTGSHTAQTQIGSPVTPADLAFTQGATGGRPWIEFANTLSMTTQAWESDIDAEVLGLGDGGNVRVSSIDFEHIGVGSPGDVDVSDIFVEAMGIAPVVEFDASRLTTEIMGIPTVVEADLSAIIIEIMGIPGTPPASHSLLFVDGTPVQVKFPGLGWQDITTIDDT